MRIQKGGVGRKIQIATGAAIAALSVSVAAQATTSALDKGQALSLNSYLEQVQTSSGIGEEMNTEHIDIKTPHGTCDSYIAYPGDENYPAALLYMDAFGPRDYLFEMAKTLASNGYFVLVPNMFYRSRRAPVVDFKFPLSMDDRTKAFGVIGPMYQTLTSELAMSDAGVFLDFLSKQKHARKGKVGLTGYCLGGVLAFRTAAKFPNQIAAAASFHGAMLATGAPDSPHLGLPKIKAELYFAHAENDQSMPVDQIARLDEALKASGVKFKSETYAGAQHGFTMLDLPAGNKLAVERHWKNLLPLFKRALG